MKKDALFLLTEEYKNYSEQFKYIYEGIGGHLFAEAVKRSFADGFGGAVFFVAKTNLIEHYEKELGANLIDYRSRRMFINERAAKVLYDKYYGGNL